MVKFAGGEVFPFLFRNLGLLAGVPHFTTDSWHVNSFPTDFGPTDSDRSLSSSALFRRLIQEKTVFYSAPGRVADWDADGRLDIFLASWWPEMRPLLLHNETPCGNWLQVSVEGTGTINRMGIGSRILVYRAGKIDNQDALLGCREIAVGFGYASGQPAIAHSD